MKKLIVLLLFTSFNVFGQHHEMTHQELDPLSDPHHHRHPLRVAFLLGHGMVPDAEGQGVYFIPTWGLDVDLHLSDSWSLGWHSDLELENYVVIDGSGESVELETPLVTTLDLFYRLSHNVLIGVGPGITREQGELKSLIRLGLEAEVPLNDRWEWTPTFYLDRRLDGHTVWTLAIGVAHYL